MTTHTKSAAHAHDDLALWSKDLTSEPIANPLRIPFDIFLREAATAAQFVDTHWDATDVLPGLSRVKKRLGAHPAEDIRSLVRAVQAAQTKLLLLVDPMVVDHGERARFLVDELESVLEFLLDDGVEEPADAQLAQIEATQSQNGERSSALSQTLAALSALAAELKDRLVDADEGFDPALIAEGKALATTLSTAVVSPRLTPEAALVQTQRNQLLVKLTTKVGTVRSCARRVYRGHPEVIRLVTSAYERRQRSSRRAKAPATPTAPAASAPTSATPAKS